MPTGTLPDGRPLLRDDDKWTKVPYQVSFGSSFTTMTEAAGWMVGQYECLDKKNQPKTGDLKSTDDVNRYLIDSLEFLDRPYYKDTRLGCNDAYNILPQYNRDDDIVHPSMCTQYIDDNNMIGMGRVYSSTTFKNQQIAWFTFGIPRFSALSTFYLNAFDKTAVDINNTGYSDNFNWDDIFHALGEGAALAITLPLVPLCWFYNFAKRLLDHPINRYYDLRMTMPLYYRYVDGILAHWLVNTGMFGNGNSGGTFKINTGGNETNTDPALSGIPKTDGDNILSLIGNVFTSFTGGQDATPLAMQYIGVSMFDIIEHKIAMMKNAKSMTARSSGSVLQHLNAGSSALFKQDGGYEAAMAELQEAWDNSATMWEVLSSSALGAAQWVGFRVEKSTDASESFSNSTSPSSAAEKLNSASQSAASKSFDAGLANGASSTGVDFVDGFIDGLRETWSTITNAIGLEDLATVSTGVAIDIPERYSGSDFSKSHSLTFQLRSPYGDSISIYQNIIVPLALLLAASLPRAAGPNSYMSPFLTRVYCKGMFSIPLGIIDNISIKRGSSEFGWTYNQLPTCIDVTVSIKDLGTAMYCPIESNNLPNLLGANSTFAEYMLTISGVGLWERVSRLAQAKREIARVGYNIRNHTANPVYWMSNLADSFLVQAFASVIPTTWVNRN